MMRQVLQTVNSWLTSERKGWIAGIVLCSMLSAGLMNGHTTQGAISHISDQLGDTKAKLGQTSAVAGCEEWRAKKAAGLALQPQIVQPSQIPADNCHIGSKK